MGDGEVKGVKGVFLEGEVGDGQVKGVRGDAANNIFTFFFFSLCFVSL